MFNYLDKIVKTNINSENMDEKEVISERNDEEN